MSEGEISEYMDGIDRKWVCSTCHTECDIDWLKCPNCGDTAFKPVLIDQSQDTDTNRSK
jgi:rubrerythrin